MYNDNRNITIDILKGIGIISIVIGHACNTSTLNSSFAESTQRFVYTFHIAIFFFCSGYCYRKIDFSQFLAKKIKTLYIPFIVFNLFSFILLPLWNYFSVYPSLLPFDIFSRIVHILMFQPLGILVGAIWFIPFLFITLLIYKVTTDFLDNFPIFIEIIIIFSLGLLGIFLTSNGLIDFYYINKSLVMLPIVLLGKLFHIFESKMQKFICLKSFFVSMGLLIFINSIFPFHIDIACNQLHNNFLFYPITLIGILFCLSSAKILYNMKYVGDFIAICGKNSIYIMVFHFIVFKLIDISIFTISKNSVSSYDVLSRYPISYNCRILYSILGVVFPLIVNLLIKEIKYKISNT